MIKERKIEPLLSVIIPIYNNSQYVYDCLASVFRQDYPLIELILADDGSAVDDSVRIKEYVRLHKGNNIVDVLFLRSEENKGTVSNINHAIGQAKGDYLFTISADDTLFDAATLTEWTKVFREQDADVVIGLRQGCDEQLNPKFIAPNRKKAKLLETQDADRIWKELCRDNFIFGCATARSAKCVQRYGMVPSCYRLIEDHPMNLRWYRLGANVVFVDRLVVRHRNGGVSNAANISDSYITDMRAVYENEVIPYVKHKRYWKYQMEKRIRQRIRESRYIRMRKKSDTLLWSIICHAAYPEIIIKYLRNRSHTDPNM